MNNKLEENKDPQNPHRTIYDQKKMEIHNKN